MTPWRGRRRRPARCSSGGARRSRPRSSSTACARRARARRPRACTGRRWPSAASCWSGGCAPTATRARSSSWTRAAPTSEEDLDAAVRAAASLAVHLARAGGCALLIPGDRRPATMDPGLVGWAHLHARLALVEGGSPPPLSGLAARRGPIVYVAARRLTRPPRALAHAPGGGRVLVVPGELAGRRAAFTRRGLPRLRAERGPPRVRDRRGRGSGRVSAVPAPLGAAGRRARASRLRDRRVDASGFVAVLRAGAVRRDALGGDHAAVVGRQADRAVRRRGARRPGHRRRARARRRAPALAPARRRRGVVGGLDRRSSRWPACPAGT